MDLEAESGRRRPINQCVPVEVERAINYAQPKDFDVGAGNEAATMEFYKDILYWRFLGFGFGLFRINFSGLVVDSFK